MDVQIAEACLEPWSEEDLPLLENLLGDPEMMAHLGGPESREKIALRHRRYLQLPESGTGCMFKIVLSPRSDPVGSIGYWDKIWRGQQIYEIGWSVLPAYQGRGIATQAARAAVARARLERRRHNIHAFPAVANGASNAICRKLGFSLIEACEVEYPAGNLLRVNDWCFDLFR